MRHRVKGNHFNRDTNNRKALLMNLVRSLIERGAITTTKGKATEVERLTNKMIAKAKNNTVETRRLLHKFFGKRDVVNTLVDKIAPLFTDRKSGFTTSADMGTRRGDNASLVKISLLKQPDTAGTLKAPKKPKVVKETKGKKVVAEKKSIKSVKPSVSKVPKKVK